MLSDVRLVPVRTPARCPSCHCFVRLDQGTCTACGVPFALASESRRAETRPFEAQGVAIQSGPKGNAQHSYFQNLLPNGKNRKVKRGTDNQMNLFQGVL